MQGMPKTAFAFQPVVSKPSLTIHDAFRTRVLGFLPVIQAGDEVRTSSTVFVEVHQRRSVVLCPSGRRNTNCFCQKLVGHEES